MSAESLKEKMKEFAEGKTGAVKITGSDLSGGDASKRSDVTTGTVEAVVPDAAKRDVFGDADAAAELHQGMLPSYLDEKIDITEEDRSAFLQALVTGGRYERDFSIFGGKLVGVIRCRKIAESDGIIAWMSHCINTQKLDARIEYLTSLRNATLAIQIKSLRGLVSEDFPEVEGPYGPTRSEDGKTIVEPKWVKLADAWGSRPEALATALHNEIRKFEKRYWAMVAESANQNFWNPAAST